MPKKVLLVDDDTNVLDLMETTLRADERLVLLRATNGDDAVRLCRDEHPGLVLMDVWLPLREGYGVCRLIKHDPATAGIKVLMMTAFASEEARDAARKVGADDFMTKPFETGELMNKVLWHLEL